MVSPRWIAAWLVVPALVVGLASKAKAGPHKKRLDAGIARHAAMPARSLASNGESGYYEHILDKVPFGSQLWWRVYDSQPKGR
jgi:hypothetical protein